MQRLEGLLAEQVVRVGNPRGQAGQVVCLCRVGALQQFAEECFPARVQRRHASLRRVDLPVECKRQQMAHRQGWAVRQARHGVMEQGDGVAKAPCPDQHVSQVGDGIRIAWSQFHAALQACYRCGEVAFGGEYQGGIVE